MVTRCPASLKSSSSQISNCPHTAPGEDVAEVSFTSPASAISRAEPTLREERRTPCETFPPFSRWGLQQWTLLVLLSQNGLVRPSSGRRSCSLVLLRLVCCVNLAWEPGSRVNSCLFKEQTLLPSSTYKLSAVVTCLRSVALVALRHSQRSPGPLGD